MKERKPLYLLIFALILTTISFILISIWGYHYYFQETSKKVPNQPVAIEKAFVPNVQKNTISAINDTTIENRISPASPDSIIQSKLAQIDKLTAEIREILSNKMLSAENEDASRQIIELKQSIDDLRSQNYEVQKENGRLNKMMEELLANKEINKENDANKNGNNKRISSYAASLPLLVAHLRFTAFDIQNKATSVASKTQYFSGSFLIKAKPDNPSPYIYIVILAPNGKTLSTDAKTHSFKTADGVKEYSEKLSFNNALDNQKRLHFSVHVNTFAPGKYRMQLYHQGILIGRMSRTLY